MFYGALSIFAFLCPPTWSHDENVDCPPLYHVIMESYTLIVGVLKYFLFLGFLSALSFILWGFFRMALLSIFAFLCPPTWSHDENVGCPPLYHVIMASCTLIVGLSKYFLFWGFLSTLSFILWGFCPTYGTYFHFCFSLSDHMIAWRECFLSTPVSCDHGIVHLDCTDCWSIKIFSVLGDFVHFEFYPFRLLSYGAFVHFAFLCPPTWSHDENVVCPPLYRDHGIVHLDCFSIKIFSLFGWFCPLWVLSFGAFVLRRFCPFLLFSVHPRDPMTRMLIVHSCIMWSWDRTP